MRALRGESVRYLSLPTLHPENTACLQLLIQEILKILTSSISESTLFCNLNVSPEQKKVAADEFHACQPCQCKIRIVNHAKLLYAQALLRMGSPYSAKAKAVDEFSTNLDKTMHTHLTCTRDTCRNVSTLLIYSITHTLSVTSCAALRS